MVSVIVPVFNGEKFIERCLESLLNQSYKDIEILMINDGSTDNTEKLLEQFMYKDKRCLLINIENHGVSYARNLGLNKAKGEYIVFCDSDDYYSSDAIEKLVSSIEKYDVDLVQSKYFIEKNGKSSIVGKISNSLISNKQAIENLTITDTDVIGAVWGKMFKSSIAKNILFSEDIFYGEDVLWVLKYLLACNNAFLLNNPLYYYCYNDCSAVHIKKTEKNFSLLKMTEEAIELVKTSNCDMNNFLIRYCKSIISLLPTMYRLNKELYEKYMLILSQTIGKCKLNLKDFIMIKGSRVVLKKSPVLGDNILKLGLKIKHPILALKGVI